MLVGKGREPDPWQWTLVPIQIHSPLRPPPQQGPQFLATYASLVLRRLLRTLYESTYGMANGWTTVSRLRKCVVTRLSEPPQRPCWARALIDLFLFPILVSRPVSLQFHVITVNCYTSCPWTQF
jgi:hypothetical protein